MTRIDSTRTRLKEWFAAHPENVAELAGNLIRIPSVNPKFDPEESPGGEARVQEYVAAELRGMGIESTLEPVIDDRPNLVTPLDPLADRTLAFNAHIDVVPSGDSDSWSVDPFGGTVSGDRVYGRGSMDMKGGLACELTAMRALRESGAEVDGRLALHAVVDEEAGGLGTRSLLARLPSAPTGAIVCEPSDEDVQIAAGGLDWVRVTVRGRSGHAGWRYAEVYPQPYGSTERESAPSVNAIDLASDFLRAVANLERQWAAAKIHPLLPPGITTISPGAIRGGSGLDEAGLPRLYNNPAVIPDSVAVDFDLKFLPGEDATVRREFEEFVSTWSRQHPWTAAHPPLISWNLAEVHFPSMDTSPGDPLTTSLTASYPEEPRITGFAAVADAAFYAGVGTSAIIFGPRGSGIHGPDEWVSIESMNRVARVLAFTALAYLDEGE